MEAYLAGPYLSLAGIKRGLEQGVDVNTRNPWGRTALIVAAREKDGPILQFLLEEGADVDARDYSGMTALMVAAKYGRFNTVRRLLEWDADPTLEDNFGYSALLLSKHSGCYDTTHLIKTALAALKTKKTLFRDIRDLKMLHSDIIYAAWEAKHEAVLVKEGSDQKPDDSQKRSSSLRSMIETSKSAHSIPTYGPCMAEMMNVPDIVNYIRNLEA
eukprot:CAMPEP_0167798302 /NCGR_PEP_ID=MMETSP0111_2-20121227/16229_1 /TAXON_ID=91324 /ORGANISM="Lotharella globosa, Strain CCCM811" /LENGTH=214 /DNA_ID=CAMNT_0007692693 /DNA_START=27 /DNA_END=671 /DNA_ORIENTATION=+